MNQLQKQIKEKLEKAVLETANYYCWKPIREALALLEQAEPPAGELTKEEDLVIRVRKAIAFVDPLGKQSLIDRRKVSDNAILELCRRLDAQSQEIEEQAKMYECALEEIHRLTAEKQAQAERIEKLCIENAKLRGEEPIPSAWWKDCPELAQRTMERIMQKNDAQQQKIENLQNCMKALWSEKQAQTRTIELLKMADDSSTKAIGDMDSELDTQAQVITELEADKVQLENDACVAREEIEKQRKQIIEYGRHTRSCPMSWGGLGLPCSCGWDTIEQTLMKEKVTGGKEKVQTQKKSHYADC